MGYGKRPGAGPSNGWRWIAAAMVVAAVSAGDAYAARRLGAAEVLDRVQRWLDETRDLQGAFEQELISGALGSGIEELGRVTVARPGRMRWDYLEPESKVALVDGDRTLLYVAEDEQMWEGRLDDADSLLPRLLAGAERLDEFFSPSLEDAGRSGPYRLRLVPKTDGESFQEVILTLRPPKFGLEEVEVLDSAGNRMVYRFSQLRRNRGVPERAFAFEPPAGTEVSRLPEPAP